MAELKEMLNNVVAVIKDFFQTIKAFVADVSGIQKMPWEGEEWA